MGKTITLTASDGHSFGAYRADPSGTPKGGIVVIQEIFGVNSHIRDLADGFAKDGYVAIAPAVFDRQRKGVELGYDADSITAGRTLKDSASYDDAVRDIQAAVAAIEAAGKVGTVGYCWGGTLSYLAGTRIDGVSAQVTYYGGQIIPFNDEKLKCPSQMHFGENDGGIPLSDVEKIKAAHPEAEVHVYAAGHGFNCDQRKDYEAECAKQARTRTMAFFAKHLS